MSRTPRKLSGSHAYSEGWRAVNLLIRSEGSWSGRERDVCYRNLGDGTFADTSSITGLDSAGDGRGFVTLDIDGDGAMDLIEASRTAPRVRVLRNRNPAAALVLELRGTAQPDAIGATAEVTTSHGRRLLRQVEAGSGFLTQSSRRLHFALLPGETPEMLQVRWPGGARQEWRKVPGTGTFRATENQSALLPMVAPPAPPREHQPEAKAASVWLAEPIPPPALSGFRADGRKTLLNFWASWCPPCREEMKEWSSPAARKRLAAAGLRVVIVAANEEGGQRPTTPFPVVTPTADELAAWNLFHRHLYDHRRDIALPSSFLLDERGRVVKIYHGITPSAAIAADLSSSAASRSSIPFPGRWLGQRPGRNYVEIATALAEAGLPKESARYFELAIARGNPPREALSNYAGALLETGDLAKAEKLLLTALAGGETDNDALTNMGLLRLRQGRHAEARTALEKALTVAPDDALALNGLGSALFAGQDIAGALERFARAVELDPGNSGYRYNWASALAASGEFPAAVREFERVREKQGESAALSNNLGVLYVETGDPAKGEAEFRKAIRLSPKEAGGYLNLASLYGRTSRVEDARQILREFLLIAPQHPQAVRMLDSLR